MEANDIRRRWLPRAVAVVAVAALGVFAWSRRSTYAPPDIGGLAPNIQAVTLAGTTVELEQYRGRVVLLNVWATWCRPCVTEMPALQRTYDRLNAEGFDVIAVSVDNAALGLGDPAQAVRDFVAEHAITFPILLDPESRIENALAIAGLPMSWLIDRSGHIRGRFIGPRDWDDPEFEAEIRSLLES
jgi:peroxiredoxin